MTPDHLRELTRARLDDALSSAATPADACRQAADTLGSDGGPMVTVLLRVHEGLRAFAASGTWRMHYSVPLPAGPAGEAYASGRTVVDVPAGTRDPQHRPTPGVAMAMYVPVPGSGGEPVGVLKLEWPEFVNAAPWQQAAQTMAAALGARLERLGYTPKETMAERLVRHALSIVSSTNETLLIGETLTAARDVSGLSTAVGIAPVPPDNLIRLRTAPGDTSTLTERMRGLTTAELEVINDRTHRYGTWYTVGDPDTAPAPSSQPLLDVGARTVIAIPLGGQRGADARTGHEHPGAGQRTMLIMDEEFRPVSTTTVALLELLAAQSLISLERLRLLEALRAQAKRDPLTGLGHQATFGERMTHSEPGRTALLLVDVDNFKQINDTRGHAAGDQVLVDLVQALGGALRSRDEMYRIGGDEFVVVVEINRAAEARGIAKRLLNAAHWVGCTVSIGVALQGQGETAEDALHRADAAMYAAKRAGRDRIELAVPPEQQAAAGAGIRMIAPES